MPAVGMTDGARKGTPDVRDVLRALDDWCVQQAEVTRRILAQAEVERESESDDHSGPGVTGA